MGANDCYKTKFYILSLYLLDMQIQEGSLVRILFFNITDSIKKSRLLSASSHTTNYLSYSFYLLNILLNSTRPTIKLKTFAPQREGIIGNDMLSAKINPVATSG